MVKSCKISDKFHFISDKSCTTSWDIVGFIKGNMGYMWGSESDPDFIPDAFVYSSSEIIRDLQGSR